MVSERYSPRYKVQLVGVHVYNVLDDRGYRYCGHDEHSPVAMNVFPYRRWINVMMEVFWWANGTRLHVDDPLPPL